MRSTLIATLVLSTAFTLGACAENTPAFEPDIAIAENRAPAPDRSVSIADLAVNNGLTELVGALTYVDAELETGLVQLFSEGTDQFTVFAPTNEAFEGLYALLTVVTGEPVAAITDIPPSVVLAVLQYHVATGRRAANSVVPRVGTRTIDPLLGESFAVRTNGTIIDGLTPLDARADAAIVGANVSARNGIVHVINQVIVPPSVVAALTGGN